MKKLNVPDEMLEVLERLRVRVNDLTYNSMKNLTDTDLMRILAKKIEDAKFV